MIRQTVLKQLSAVLVVATACTLCLLGPAQQTHAHHDGVDNMFPTTLNADWWCYDWGHSSPYNGLFCQTDNATLTYYTQVSVINGTGQSNIDDIMSNQFGPTDLSVQKHATAEYSGDAETDIIFTQKSDLSPELYGLTVCDDATDIVRCDQHYVIFRSIQPFKGVVCHEAGHAVGLTHGDDACYIQYGGFCFGIDPDDSRLECMRNPYIGVATLGVFNAAHINAQY